VTGRFAANTDVSSDRSRTEIERTITRYGATRFGFINDHDSATIVFELNNRRIKFVLPLPPRDSDEFTRTPTGRKRKADGGAAAAYEQAIRQRWRALSLCIKAKLEAVETGITTFDNEFMAHIVMPNGQTCGEMITPQISTAYSTGKMPPLLPRM